MCDAELSQNIKKILCEADGRAKVIAATKTVDVGTINKIYDMGIHSIGENRVQELLEKYEYYDKRFDLHFIGRLQRNKVKYIIDGCALIHSVDSLTLGMEIDRLAAARGKIQPVLIEVNSADEATKGGISADSAEELLIGLRSLPHLSVAGIMTMGPRVSDPEDIRPYFRATRELYDRLNEKYRFDGGGILSMGMSDSFRVAIEEGATLVRVGTRLFEK